MDRRNFIKNSAAISALSFLPNQLISPNTSMQTIKSKRLQTGDTIGLMAPGSYITEEELKQCIENIESVGFKVFYTENILAKTGYLAGDDNLRATVLNKMFADKSIKGIMCARGGYGCTRILPLIDYSNIKTNPKVFIGYSDVTALSFAILNKTGLITFNGPVGISTFNDFSKENFNNVLVNPTEKYILKNAEEKKSDEAEIKIIRSGKAKGKLVGGNLSVVTSLIGTPYDMDFSNKIVFLEEINEEPYRIDRMLTQLIQSGKLNKSAGIALGNFLKCEAIDNKSEFSSSFTLMEVLLDRLYNLKIPVIYGLSFGHIVNKFTIPVGTDAELDVDNQILTLLEPAVI